MAGLLIAVQLLGIASAMHAIMNVRTEQGTVAWAVSLVAMPYVAVPAYWIFGRTRFEGYVTARRGDELEVAGISDQAVATTRLFAVPEDSVNAATRVAAGLAGLPLVRGNDVELLVDGDATFHSILAAIDDARDYLLVQFYIVRDDRLGQDLKARLITSAARGVRTFFLYDEIGSHRLPSSYLTELRAGGVEVSAFNSRRGPRNRLQLNFRNHRKVVVVDGREAWIGGHNVGDEYLGRDPDVGPWRDTHIRIEGPAALAAQLSFVEDWHWATDQSLDLSWEPHPPPDTEDAPVLIVPTGPADEGETASLMFVHAINSASRRIWIASPYFVPDPSVVTALQLAGLRGVDVRILIPERPDHLAVYLAAYSYLDDAGRTGVEFYRFQDGFMHQKVILIDDRVAGVGTANLDNRSLRLNFEITAFVLNREFASEVEAMLEKDFAASRLMEPDEYARKPWWFRVGVRLARLAAPVL